MLRYLDTDIKLSEKVGIVGRTGAGKYSIIQAVFRIFEPHLDSVYIIGHDARRMGLYSLRQHISVIPQVPSFLKARSGKTLNLSVQRVMIRFGRLLKNQV